jgi:DNA repair protein RecO (recombination protein O)
MLGVGCWMFPFHRMIETATGIVLRTRPLTETSLIVHWLTPQAGRISTVAKGARRPKSPFRGKLDLFYEADLSFVRSRRSELHTLREVNLRETNAVLRRELGYLRQASYAAALVELATERDTPLPTIFELVRDYLRALPTGTPEPRNVFAFELKLLNELGLQPDIEKSRLTPGSKQIVALLLQNPWETLNRLELSKGQITELRQFLNGFLIFHLERVPASRAGALQT